jgi:hypothetical protein
VIETGGYLVVKAGTLEWLALNVRQQVSAAKTKNCPWLRIRVHDHEISHRIETRLDAGKPHGLHLNISNTPTALVSDDVTTDAKAVEIEGGEERSQFI